MKAIIQTATACLLLAFTGTASYAQDQHNKTAVQNSIDTQNFVFVAQSVIPLRGGLRQLTSYYDLRVQKDTVASNLPYFGRAYVAPLDPQEGGLTFTSTEFQYSVKTKKKGQKEISIDTKTTGDAQRMLLSVFDNGSATLQVTSNNRDAITFNGYVKEAGKK